MAALRQFLNGRGLAKEESLISNSPEDPKMQGMGYSISPPVPQKSQSQSLASRFGEQQGSRPLHSKFNDVDSNQAWQHPLLRRNQSPTDDNNYNRSNSFDQDNQLRPHPLMRSATETNLHESTGGQSGFDMDQSSLYEENESPALSPALHKHLQLRPIDTQDHYDHKGRRRSRSVADDNGYYGDRDAWEGYGKEGTKHTRKDSLMGSQKPLPDTKESRAVQMLKDRQRLPTRQDSVSIVNNKIGPSPAQILSQSTYQGRFDSHAHQGGATKVAHTLSGSDGSPTDSVGDSLSNGVHGSPRNGRKRSRDLDYSMHQLADISYQKLKDESFDHIPEASLNFSHQDLPDATLTLSDRLNQVYTDKTKQDKTTRARGFFASLTIDQYEECGDLLLDSFKTVMDRLKQARQQKRKAAKAMEEQIARREEWVRRKRGVIEQDLGRLKTSGSVVVKPNQAR